MKSDSPGLLVSQENSNNGLLSSPSVAASGEITVTQPGQHTAHWVTDIVSFTGPPSEKAISLAMGSSICNLWTPVSGFRILDSGFWILDSGFRILDSGHWTLGLLASGFRNLGASGLSDSCSVLPRPQLCTVY